MSTAEAIRTAIAKLPRGTPFTTARFLDYGPRGTVDRALSRIVRDGGIERLARGVFIRPRKSRFVGTVLPDPFDVVRAIARDNGETVQIHGAEAARRFGLSTQAPTSPVFHTSASSRTIRIANTTVRMIHTSNRRRLQFAGEPAGAALAALWYLGRDNATPQAVASIRAALSADEFGKLASADMPAWMAAALDAAVRDAAHA